MLNGLRSFSKTWIAKILLTLLVVSFGAFGINNVITDLGTTTVARVGDEDITTREFQRAYQAQLNAAAQQLGMVPTADQATALGIPSSVISRLGADAAMNKFGENLGLGASEDRLALMLKNDPSFGGTLGGFNRQTFVQVLQQNGYTEAEYFDEQTKASRRQQLAVGLFGDTAVPAAAQDLISRYSGDKRTIDYFVINSTSVPSPAAPTEEELAAYLKEHQADFRTVETRTVDVLVLSPDTLAATKTITDADIAAEYERTKASLVKPERRTIRQLVLPNDAAVTAFETGKAAGKTFDELATEANLKPTELGTLSAGQITDAALAKAAFEVAQGDSVIISGAVGKRAINVTAIEAGGETPLAEARDTIAKNLALTQAKAEYADILDQVEELRASFKPLSEIATRFNLPLSTVAVTAAGAELASVPAIAEESRAKVATAIFAAQADKLEPTVQLGATNNVWFDLKSTEVARDKTLDEVRDAVTTAWTEEKTNEAIKAQVDKIMAQLKSGTSFADVAAAENQFPQLSQPITRQGDGTPVLNAAVAGAAFGGGEGHFGSAVNGDGDQVIFHVADITPSTEPSPEKTRTFVEESVRDDLYGEFVTGLRDDAGLRINQQAMTQLLSVTTGN